MTGPLASGAPSRGILRSATKRRTWQRPDDDPDKPRRSATTPRRRSRLDLPTGTLRRYPWRRRSEPKDRFLGFKAGSFCISLRLPRTRFDNVRTSRQPPP
jgi:hypothetical protein